jgi:hypothetical protein
MLLPPNSTKLFLLAAILCLTGWELTSGATSQAVTKLVIDQSTSLRQFISKPSQNLQLSPRELLKQIPIYEIHNIASDFNQGLARVYDPEKPETVYVDKTGRIVIHSSTLSLASSAFSEGLIAVAPIGEELHKIGFLNKTGEFTISPQYDERGNQSYGFSNGLSVASLNGKYGFINRMGIWIYPPKLDFARRFSEGLAAIMVGKKWGFINSAGQIIIQPKFESGRSGIDGSLFEFSEGLAAVRVGDKIGYIDSIGHIVILPQFNEGAKFSEGLAAVKIGEKRGYINALGKVVIPPQFYLAGDFSEGLASVTTDSSPNGKFGFINETGRVMISPEFDQVKKFSEGFAAVRIGENWGFINSSGQIALPPLFSSVSSFSEGAAVISLDSAKLRGFITHRDFTRWLQHHNPSAN